MVFQFGTPDNVKTDVQEASQKTQVKKTSVKAKKTTKKTAKKTTKKTASKASTKTATKPVVKTTTAPEKKLRFSYGKTAFRAKNMDVYVTINKDNTVSVTINRAPIDTDDYYEVSDLWSFTGTIDPETGIVNYTDGRRMHFVKSITFNQSRAMYLNGKGSIKIKGNTLKCNDKAEHYADGIKFTKV